MINWNELFKNQLSADILKAFANKDISGRELYSVFVNTPNGGLVRKGLRNGTNRLRSLARKALRRRSLV